MQNRLMITLDSLRGEKRAEILHLALRHGGHNLRVFGSVARGQATDASDVAVGRLGTGPEAFLTTHGLFRTLQDLLGVAPLVRQGPHP